MFAVPFPVSLTRELALTLPQGPRALPFRCRGLIQPCLARGSGDFSVYRGLPSRLGVFLPFGPCGPSDRFLFQVLPENGSDSVPDIIFRCSPLTSWPCLAVGASLGPVFFDSIEGIGRSPGLGYPRPLGGSPGRSPGLSVILGFSGLPGKAGFLPGVALLPGATALAGFHTGNP